LLLGKEKAGQPEIEDQNHLYKEGSQKKIYRHNGDKNILQYPHEEMIVALEVICILQNCSVCSYQGLCGLVKNRCHVRVQCTPCASLCLSFSAYTCVPNPGLCSDDKHSLTTGISFIRSWHFFPLPSRICV
jgi:hypothetical protein